MTKPFTEKEIIALENLGIDIPHMWDFLWGVLHELNDRPFIKEIYAKQRSGNRQNI